MPLPYGRPPTRSADHARRLALRGGIHRRPAQGRRYRSVVRDIREGPAEEYWDRLREMMGPGGLITYWYLCRAFNQSADPDTVLLRRDMRNNAGGIMAAPLAIAAPETCGWRDRETPPAPVLYGLHILDDARDVAEIRVSRATVRRGAKM